ncbi:sensor histidine kinase [Pinibacter aurantiacus]|uniref:histidine kinase n=1 Tax=Pinibacter aurantiacus TaxID=2851599 RepID=A0A9E2SA89_9BACT|nr:HAMP domain-containing sensor histidine kinase [Pinibacter aurantiacus]MBV4358826.1 HAMP domain-containing histidine kinase [Pinibacter aurantiacus]
MSIRTIKGNLLFWKIAVVFTTLLVLLGLAFVVIASKYSSSYYTSAHQELYGDLARHLATFTKPFKDGKPDTTVTHDIIHSTMVANPSVEVYLLDTAGNITDYVVPDTTVQIRKVDIAKVKQWLTAREGDKPMGDNPKQPNEPSIFSAASVYDKGKLSGYVYAVLSSEKQRNILNAVNGHLYYRLGMYIFFTVLLVTFIVGLVTFFLITRSIDGIVNVVKRFKEGDYTARIEGHDKGNLGMLTSTFNEMADVIVDNIEKITATDKFRQELIANVSHDLRTPLAITRGYVETLMIKEADLTELDKRKYLNIIYDSAKKLSVLVEQLFQFAKLEANLITPQKEPFLINELVSDILVANELKAKERKVILHIDAAGALPAVMADIALTERVFQNLLDNAFSHTPEGGSIIVSLINEDEGIKVQVSDTGVGIAKEQQPFIFERYRQPGSAQGEKKGMGIGLAIVKKILELHQATIEVISEPGRGTTFLFVLPVIARPQV